MSNLSFEDDMEPIFRAKLSTESMKAIAESIGIANLLDETANELAEDISSRLKEIIENASKFMRHSKRKILTTQDIDNALKLKQVEPTYGFLATGHIPFRFTSGGGRALNFTEEKEVDLIEIISTAGGITWPKLPLEINLHTHWLAIDGIQPTIQDNPPPVSKEEQKLESINPIIIKNSNANPSKPGGKSQKLRNVENLHAKQLATHELSVEQQFFYKVVTEACIGPDNSRRTEAFLSLAAEPGLHEMLPRLSTFITEGVRVNVVQYNLAFLIYLMRMIKALLDNPNLCLEKYLHELIPAVVTCIVSKKLCSRPEVDNHWALRDYASRLMAQICRNFNTTTNNIQTRVSRIFSQVIAKSNEAPLTSLYGAIHGLSELGPKVINTLIIPKMKSITDSLETCLNESNSNAGDKIAVERIKTLLTKCKNVVDSWTEKEQVD